MPPEVDEVIRQSLRCHDLQRRIRRDRGEPHLVAASGDSEQAGCGRSRQRRVLRRPGLRRRRRRAAGRRTEGEIVVRPKRPHVMFEGYWGRPRSPWRRAGTGGTTPATSAASMRTSYLYFVDRKADYLRRRGENISSFEVESVLMSHGALADVAVHAVPSQLSEDDLKVTAVIKDERAIVGRRTLPSGASPSCPISHSPATSNSAIELPRSPVGRVLKRELREQGVTPDTWDAEVGRGPNTSGDSRCRRDLRSAASRVGLTEGSCCGARTPQIARGMADMRAVAGARDREQLRAQ